MTDDDDDAEWEKLNRSALDSEQLDAIENFMYLRQAWGAPLESETLSDVSTLAPTFLVEELKGEGDLTESKENVRDTETNRTTLSVTEEGMRMATEVERNALDLIANNLVYDHSTDVLSVLEDCKDAETRPSTSTILLRQPQIIHSHAMHAVLRERVRQGEVGSVVILVRPTCTHFDEEEQKWRHAVSTVPNVSTYVHMDTTCEASKVCIYTQHGDQTFYVKDISLT
eukprot:6193519-Pleurochrysis_carterae.AAC.2